MHSLPIFVPVSKLLVPGHSACGAKCEIKGQPTATHEMDVAQGTHEHSVLLGKYDPHPASAATPKAGQMF